MAKKEKKMMVKFLFTCDFDEILFYEQNRWGINSYCMDTNKNYENSQYFRMKGFFFFSYFN